MTTGKVWTESSNNPTTKIKRRIRILLAEDHEIVRKGIRALIEQQTDMEVVGEAQNGDSAVELADQLKPEIVIMDISMPKTNGLKATREIKRVCPEIKILVLSRHMNKGYVQQFIQSGVSGYILKQSAPDELISAIRAVGNGNSYLDSTITQTVMNGYIRQKRHLQGELRCEITDRETEILRLIARGYSNKIIAGQLNISVKTVETHKANAVRKLGIRDRVGIINFAISQGWMEDV